MSTPEGKVKALVKRRLNAIRDKYPGRVYSFMPVQNGMGAPSLDFLICAGGWFIAIETKPPNSPKLRPRQETTRAQILDAHGLVYVVTGPTDCEAAMRVIEACAMLADAVRFPTQDGPRDVTAAVKLPGMVEAMGFDNS